MWGASGPAGAMPRGRPARSRGIRGEIYPAAPRVPRLEPGRCARRPEPQQGGGPVPMTVARPAAWSERDLAPGMAGVPTCSNEPASDESPMPGLPADQPGAWPECHALGCPCGYSYELRRCSACNVASHVPSMQRSGEPWICVWCKAANSGYTRRDDPATATIADLAADMASHGLEFTRRPNPGRQIHNPSSS